MGSGETHCVVAPLPVMVELEQPPLARGELVMLGRFALSEGAGYMLRMYATIRLSHCDLSALTSRNCFLGPSVIRCQEDLGFARIGPADPDHRGRRKLALGF